VLVLGYKPVNYTSFENLTVAQAGNGLFLPVVRR